MQHRSSSALAGLAFGAALALAACGPHARLAGAGASGAGVGRTLSLTGYEFTGKKFYLGFGDDLDGMMGNETKYDVAHTHAVFTSAAGGDYAGTRLVVPMMDGRAIRAAWHDIGGQITKDDMYVQYSSGHGYEGGLGAGITYDDIRDNALAYGAQETIIFTMACHSGGLVDSFDKRRDDWRHWQDAGRSLFVMASSRTDQLSSTGPGRDVDEPDGPNGSAGSAFGHSLWKALIGNADGYVDGVKDGFLALDEIAAFTTAKTRAIGGHDPVVTGAYNPHLIINRVPSPRDLAAMGLEGAAAAAALADD